jgi:hypothetical protein
LRREDDGVDKAAQRFCGSRTALFVLKTSSQLRHPFPVKISHVRMEQRGRFDCPVQAGAKLRLLRLQGNQRLLTMPAGTPSLSA